MAEPQEQPTEQQGHYTSARQRRGRDKPKLQPPLAPMIDVTFQLLIFFLLTATFRSEGNIEYRFPPLGLVPTEQTQVATVNVWITQEGEGENAKPTYQVRVDNKDVAGGIIESAGAGREAFNQQSDSLCAVLSGQRQKGEEVPATIRPEGPFVQWQFVVEAYNQTRRAGFEKVGIDLQEGA